MDTTLTSHHKVTHRIFESDKFIINYFCLALQLDKTYFYTATVLVQEIQLIVFVTRKKCDSPHCVDTVTARLPSPDWAGP